MIHDVSKKYLLVGHHCSKTFNFKKFNSVVREEFLRSKLPLYWKNYLFLLGFFEKKIQNPPKISIKKFLTTPLRNFFCYLLKNIAGVIFEQLLEIVPVITILFPKIPYLNSQGASNFAFKTAILSQLFFKYWNGKQTHKIHNFLLEPRH